MRWWLTGEVVLNGNRHPEKIPLHTCIRTLQQSIRYHHHQFAFILHTTPLDYKARLGQASFTLLLRKPSRTAASFFYILFCSSISLMGRGYFIHIFYKLLARRMTLIIIMAARMLTKAKKVCIFIFLPHRYVNMIPRSG